MTRHVFKELGYFTAGAIAQIADAMTGRSWMDFRITSSNEAGNHTLIVETLEDVNEDELAGLFIHMALANVRR